MIFQISYSSFALFRSLCWLAPTPYLRNPLQQIEARQCIGSHRRWLWLVLVSTKQYLLEDAWDIGDYSRIILPFPHQCRLFCLLTWLNLRKIIFHLFLLYPFWDLHCTWLLGLKYLLVNCFEKVSNSDINEESRWANQSSQIYLLECPD